MRRLRAKAVVALLIPETDVAHQILALNTEKAHNLRENPFVSPKPRVSISTK